MTNWMMRLQQKTQLDNKLWWFFAIAFAFTWLCQLPLTLASHGLIHDPGWPRAVDWFATFGPLLAACLLTCLGEGKDSLIKLLKRGWNIHFERVWWLPTLLLLPTMQYLAVALGSLIESGKWPQLTLSPQPGFYLSFLVILVQVIGEEYGWRGYAIGRLQIRWNALVSSLILGVFWGVWHIQLWMRAGDATRTSPFLATQFYILTQAILYTWLYNNTHASLLPVLLYHSLDNFLGSKLFGIYDSFASSMAYSIIVFLTALVVVLVWGHRTLVREKSYGGNHV